MSTTGSKRKADTGDKRAQEPKEKKLKLKSKLLNEAAALADDGSRILLAGAKKLWKSALDGWGVTPQEFATLRHILDKYKFTKAARVYLDSLVTKHRSGTSMYKYIDGKRFDRSCLDLAAHLAKDGSISKPDAEQIWEDVLDGPGVTQCEANTVRYVMEKYDLSHGAKTFLKSKLKEWGKSDRTTTGSSAALSTPVSMNVESAIENSDQSVWHHAAATFSITSEAPEAAKVFEFDMGSKAFGIFVDDESCYAGDESGLVIKLKKNTGDIVSQYRLPMGVKCLVGDDGYLFAGCNNGSVYDLTGKRPRLVAELEDFSQVLWIDMYDGNAAASDADGNVALLNCEGETIWKRKSAGETGWMVRVDQEAVYHGHSMGITKYSLEGEIEWEVKTAEVLFGWQDKNFIYAGLVETACFDGEIAKRLSRAGAKSGIIVASLMWNNRDDLDLHVYVNDEHIYYGNRRSESGGELDVDMNAGMQFSDEPVENIYWKGIPPAGTFKVEVVQFNNRTGHARVPFEVHLKVRGETKKFEGCFSKEIESGQSGKKKITAFEFQFQPKSDEEVQGTNNRDLPERAVVKIDKKTGSITNTYDAGSSIPSTTTSTDGKSLYAAIPRAVKCFNGPDARVCWTLGTGTGTAMSMQASGKHLYAVCGSKMMCLDISAEAVKKAQKGAAGSGRQLVRDSKIQETKAVESAGDLEAAGVDAKGVRLKCIKEGSKLRVRPEPGQHGFNSSWNCQFPRNIRQMGARFLVDNLVVAGGNYYRLVGEIKRLS